MQDGEGPRGIDGIEVQVAQRPRADRGHLPVDGLRRLVAAQLRVHDADPLQGGDRGRVLGPSIACVPLFVRLTRLVE